MSDEPTYPKDAAVGAGVATRDEPVTAESDTEARRKKYMKAGVAVGIGSAAIVAALLYANRGKRNDQGNG